jgi:hypothetical protein
MKYYKVLDKHGRSCHGGEAEWSLPQRNEDGTWTPGEWMPEVEGPLEPCANGYHVVTLEQLPNWIGERIFEVEVGDEIVHADDKSVVRTCRLTRECTGWNERTARLFACDCAERVLPLYEAHYDDDSPRKAIEVARRYAEGTATREELAAAGDAARNAAWAATGDPTRAAAWAAARAAAWAATGDPTRNAAWAATGDPTRAAAWAAAWAATWAATGDPALNVERQWQAARLREILEVEA